MPFHKEKSGLTHLMEKVLASPRKVLTVGVAMDATAFELAFHSHDKAQLLLSLTGVGTCEAEGGLWLLPSQSALFVPGGMAHRVAAAGRIVGFAVFIQPSAAAHLPRRCTTLDISPLLRELIVRSAQFHTQGEQAGTERQVLELLLDELAVAPPGGLHLPMPSEPRLRSIFKDMMARPSQRGTIHTWARQVGLSERTLMRTIAAETGMSFGRWRQQLNVILALQWMAKGATVQQVAFDLGYENAGSFVTMFRKVLGSSPARYMAGRNETPELSEAERVFRPIGGIASFSGGIARCGHSVRNL